MAEFGEPQTEVQDIITWHPGNWFDGTIYYQDKSGLKPKEDDFRVRVTEPLDPFFYRTPSDEDPTQLTTETEPRAGYYPLKILSDVKKASDYSGHPVDGIVAAVRKDDAKQIYETKFLEKNKIDEKTWSQALEILEPKQAA